MDGVEFVVDGDELREDERGDAFTGVIDVELLVNGYWKY